MKNVLLLFGLAWAVYCLIVTGGVVADLRWEDRLQLSPSGVQERAEDIFNRGAVAASKLSDLPKPEYAILFVEDKEGLLRALPMTYWLYPVNMAPASSDYYRPDGSIAQDSGKSLAQTVSRPGVDVIYFVGDIKTLMDNSETIKDFSQRIIAEDKGQTLVLLERKK